MTRSLGVGIIGASARRGWARDAHVPAVQGLSGLTLAAVATGHQQSADAAARAFGAAAGYGDAGELINDPAVDIVTVAVKVPDHRALVLAALDAGKHVYVEWPLGRDLTEAGEMAEAARMAGVRAAIGLQASANPAVGRARALLSDGAIGRILSVRVLSTSMAFGATVEPAMAFAETGSNGVTLVTIQGAHTVDLVEALFGGPVSSAAMTTTQFRWVTVGDPPAAQARSIPDHLLVLDRLAGGAALSIEVAGGRPMDATPFRLEATGETGTLVLEGGASRGLQSGRLRLLLNGTPQAVDEAGSRDLPDAALSVAGIYAMLRDDIEQGCAQAPDFDHAVALTRRMDELMASARAMA